jgi:hypothetical protein
MSTFQPFSQFTPGPDAIWVTPGAKDGVRFVLTRPDLNGNELVGIVFTDPVCGPMVFCVPVGSVEMLTAGFLTVLENADELRAGYQRDESNETKGTIDD